MIKEEFPGKTKLQEFTDYVTQEYDQKILKVDDKDFKFSIQEDKWIFEHEIEEEKKKVEEGEEDSEEVIEFNDKYIIIQATPFLNNSDELYFSFLYKDGEKEKRYKASYNNFKLSGENLADSEEYFEICEKIIKKFLKKI